MYPMSRCIINNMYAYIKAKMVYNLERREYLLGRMCISSVSCTQIVNDWIVKCSIASRLQ
jgi:hypothetical protein